MRKQVGQDWYFGGWMVNYQICLKRTWFVQTNILKCYLINFSVFFFEIKALPKNKRVQSKNGPDHRALWTDAFTGNMITMNARPSVEETTNIEGFFFNKFTNKCFTDSQINKSVSSFDFFKFTSHDLLYFFLLLYILFRNMKSFTISGYPGTSS